MTGPRKIATVIFEPSAVRMVLTRTPGFGFGLAFGFGAGVAGAEAEAGVPGVPAVEGAAGVPLPPPVVPAVPVAPAMPVPRTELVAAAGVVACAVPVPAVQPEVRQATARPAAATLAGASTALTRNTWRKGITGRTRSTIEA